MPALLFNPYVWLVTLALLLSSYLTGRWHQYQSDQKDLASAELKATQAARSKEQEWSVIYAETATVKQKELDAVASERDRLAGELRNRANRLPETARSACQGTTGRELSNRDAEAFGRLAARAEVIRLELKACYAREDALVGK